MKYVLLPDPVPQLPVPGGPGRRSKTFEEEALHVENGAGIHEQLPAVGLRYWAALVPEEDGGRPVQRVVELLAEGRAAGRLPVQAAARTGPPSALKRQEP